MYLKWASDEESFWNGSEGNKSWSRWTFRKYEVGYATWDQCKCGKQFLMSLLKVFMSFYKKFERINTIVKYYVGSMVSATLWDRPFLM